ncbi:hypothetical protein [Ulvibacter antarcticus]|uniref:Uncharacterized protein n=1 Tax=Ulvibacter antarcticus TaxID=442714 RepID=A0A3L9Y8F5_9FLAO|nr:hypothetical protein [Ulvibacter antarcticus]RMA56654.1 hypothetical protein BXY75_3357 [Ulvibacter antarcticus]
MEFKLLALKTLSFNKVRYYSIQKEGFEKSEFKDFTDRMILLGASDSRVLSDLIEIRSQLKLIGDKFGAKTNKFKMEGKAFGLALQYPSRKNKLGIYGLRVYCIILSDNIVILMNGGDKTKKKAQDCSNVSIYFHEANHFTTIFNNYIQDGTLNKYYRDLINDNDDPLFY